MMFVAMNNFKVAQGKEQEFERIWKTRESHLAGVPGFVRFALLRGGADGEYISHSTWESQGAFVAWTQSENFAAGHRQGSLMGVLAGPPVVKLYEAVIEQEAPAAAAP